MAEFCLDCMNKYDVAPGRKQKEKDVILENDLCEGCGQIKPCVIKINRRSLYKLGVANS